jgi:hypothetical protein
MRYRVTQPLMLHPGALLGLTEQQVAARTFALAAEGERWRVMRPVGFKAGEVIDVEPPDAVAKSQAQALEPVEVLAAVAAPTKRARKPAQVEA